LLYVLSMIWRVKVNIGLQDFVEKSMVVAVGGILWSMNIFGSKTDYERASVDRPENIIIA